MRVWSFQPVEIYEQLKSKKILYADKDKIEMFHFDGKEDLVSKRAYDYMVEKMVEKINYPKPEQAKYPWWAWYKFDGKNKKPDMRKKECHYSEDMVCLELELPDNQVLLSDEELWHCPLNNAPIILDEDDKTWNWMYDWYQSLDITIKQSKIEKTWEHCFDVSSHLGLGVYLGQWIQATFWELRLTDIKDVRYVKSRS